MLEATGLRKEFGHKVAVEDVSFTLNKGELFGFLGPNGAGKTTTIRMLVGLLRPTRGEIQVAGVDLQRRPMEAKRRLGYVPDRPMVHDKLTGREFLRFMASLYDLPARAVDEADHWLEQFDLTESADDLISTYSHGMKQKIGLIGQLIHEPEVLLLDEPTVGLDPKSARTLRNVLNGLCAKGVTVLISTHLLPIAEMMCHRVGIMDRGRLIAIGSIAELQERYHTESNLEDLFLRLTEAAEGERRT
ncbi:ABC transporter ATP-binding protein [Alicyclobacillus ferrooxydans]|uniref:ABC transporter ATP-binding protein n=1 Tax=Alicyclobacillus ferrooxydans TaxID=471514 RepID=UPI000AC649B3|nr:ABC transporter ATP-binding protein [Alicyclobacillus ferrooxydans]